MEPANVEIGAEFGSFDVARAEMERCEISQMVNYWMRDSSTISAYQKRQGSGVTVNPQLKYGEVKWACIKGVASFLQLSRDTDQT